MESTVITVIAAMYNGEKYIRECIDSILNQDYKNLDVILVDDGSPDNCGKIADEYKEKDHRVRVIHQDNQGVSASRNHALKIARGEYICIIDQDDIIAKEYVSYLYKLCVDNNASISLTPTVDKFFSNPHNVEDNDSVSVLSGEETAIMMLYHKIVISPWNKMFKTKLITQNNITFNTKYFNGEGFAFSIECYLHAERVAIGHKKVYHYRVGDPETGASKFKEEYILSSIGAQKYIKSKLPAKHEKIEKAWAFSNWHTHCDCYNIMVGCKAEKYYPNLYNRLKTKARKDALIALVAPVSFEQRTRGILFKIQPKIAALIINKFRVRKFAKYNPEKKN